MLKTMIMILFIVIFNFSLTSCLWLKPHPHGAPPGQVKKYTGVHPGKGKGIPPGHMKNGKAK
jgi:hypothetical protein